MRKNRTATIEEQIQDQRGEIFGAQGIIDVCRRAVDQQEDWPMHEALLVAYETLDRVAAELDEIAMQARGGSDPDPDPGEAEPATGQALGVEVDSEVGHA